MKTDAGFTSRLVWTEDILEIFVLLVLADPDYLFVRSTILALGRGELHLGQELLLALIGCLRGGLLRELLPH